MDVLSDILSTVRLASEIYLSVELSAPWGVAFPEQPDRVPFYVVSRGSCHLRVEGADQAALVGGDLIMLPSGTAHSVRDHSGTPDKPVDRVVAEGVYDERGAFHYGGGGERTALIVGRFRFQSHAAVKMLAGMPPLIHLRSELAHSGSGLSTTLRSLSSEASSNFPGKEILMDRLADVLFVKILRAFVAHEEEAGRTVESRAGLVQALMDPELSKALALMHRKPEHRWTVGELASRIGMSRTAFAVRFKTKAGMGPMEHLTLWRMQKAAEMLREEKMGLEEVAWKVGYESAAAFSKAFKRQMGVAPGSARRSAR